MKRMLLVMATVFALAMSAMSVASPAEEDFTEELTVRFAGPAQVELGDEHEFAVRLQNRSNLPTRGGVLLEFEVIAGADRAAFEWCGPTFLANTGGREADTGAGSGYGDTIEPKEPLDPDDYTCELRGFEGWQPIDLSDGPFTTPATGGGADFPFWYEDLTYGYTATRLLRVAPDRPGAIVGEFRAVSYDGALVYDSVRVTFVARPDAPVGRDR